MANIIYKNNNTSLHYSNGSSFEVEVYFAVPCCGFFWNPSNRIRSGEIDI